jgi:hypothetical protein
MLERSVEPTPRSATPKVVGILAIVFASLGLLTATLPLGMFEDIDVYVANAGPIDDYLTWLLINSLAGLLLFGVHLTAGIFSVRYSARAPRWMTAYGIAAIVLGIVDIVVSVMTFPEGPSSRVCAVGFDDLVGPRITLAAIALPWPIVALVLMNMRSAKQSCKS